MCGRFTQLYRWQDLVDAYRIHDAPASNLEPRYNITPTQTIDVVVPGGDGHGIVPMRWGLVPGWWKKGLKEVPATFNARAETVHEKPMFRTAIKTRRCVIPASGFYEWTGEKKDRLPWYITPAKGAVLSLAGIWDKWRNPETGEEVFSATVVTCAANGFMSRLHDRMPVILDPAGIDAWMASPDPELLKPAPEDVLQAWRVSPAVNSNRYHEPDAIEAIEA